MFPCACVCSCVCVCACVLTCRWSARCVLMRWNNKIQTADLYLGIKARVLLGSPLMKPIISASLRGVAMEQRDRSWREISIAAPFWIAMAMSEPRRNVKDKSHSNEPHVNNISVMHCWEHNSHDTHKEEKIAHLWKRTKENCSLTQTHSARAQAGSNIHTDILARGMVLSKTDVTRTKVQCWTWMFKHSIAVGRAGTSPCLLSCACVHPRQNPALRGADWGRIAGSTKN